MEDASRLAQFHDLSINTRKRGEEHVESLLEGKCITWEVGSTRCKDEEVLH